MKLGRHLTERLRGAQQQVTYSCVWVDRILRQRNPMVKFWFKTLRGDLRSSRWVTFFESCVPFATSGNAPRRSRLHVTIMHTNCRLRGNRLFGVVFILIRHREGWCCFVQYRQFWKALKCSNCCTLEHKEITLQYLYRTLRISTPLMAWTSTL